MPVESFISCLNLDMPSIAASKEFSASICTFVASSKFLTFVFFRASTSKACSGARPETWANDNLNASSACSLSGPSANFPIILSRNLL